jgi:hypothetical protein
MKFKEVKVLLSMMELEWDGHDGGGIGWEVLPVTRNKDGGSDFVEHQSNGDTNPL